MWEPCVYRYRIYHAKQSLTFLCYFSLSYSSTNIQTACPQRGFPSRSLKYCTLLPKLQAVISRWVGERARSKFISDSFKSKLNSDSSDEKEMILKQNLDVLVPTHIGTINFPCHFLEQIQRADWGAIVFGSWVDVISNRRPRLHKTRSCNKFKRDFERA